MHDGIQMEHITRSFGGIKALDEVSFEIRPAEIHALVGENGAGKSTLMKILCGVLAPDQGQILQGEAAVEFSSPAQALKKGICCIHQELTLLVNLSIMENLLFSAEWGRNFRLNWKTCHTKTRQILQRLGLTAEPRTIVGKLGIAEQQMIEIARALAAGSQYIVMDEPTSSLAPQEVEKLFGVIRDLIAEGRSIVFISHKMDEIFEIAHRITVLKDGQKVATVRKEDVSRSQVIEMIVGRELNQVFPPLPAIRTAETLFALRKFCTANIKNLELEIRPGEIFGLAGLEGQGQRELLKAIYTGSYHSGSISLGGRTISVSHPKDSLALKLGMVPGDRKAEGLIAELSVRENISLASISIAGACRFVSPTREIKTVNGYVNDLRIKTPSSEVAVFGLSGGNQQKVVLAKMLATDARVLLLEEPTRGVDVGAKMEIYRLICELAGNGIALIIYSTEMMELIGLCHRIGVMYRGSFTRILDQQEATEQAVIKAALGLAELRPAQAK